MLIDPEPAWLTLAKDLMPPLFQVGSRTLRHRHPNIHVEMMPFMALLHLEASVRASLWAENQGYRSIGISVLRQCVEALTLIDLGLQPHEYNTPVFLAWEQGKKSHGQIRAQLEADVWPRYGVGLWNEPWAEFFGKLARAVQAYAHYSPELMRWQVFLPNQTPVPSDDGTLLLLAKVSHGEPDPVKSYRIYLMNALVMWTLGRLLLANSPPHAEFEDKLQALGKALGESQLLFKNRDWNEELTGNMFFMPEHDWSDPPYEKKP
jgi:hypothetical protein